MSAYVVWVVEDEHGNTLALLPTRAFETHKHIPGAHRVRRHEPLGAERHALAHLLRS